MSEVEKHQMLIEHLLDAYAYYQLVTDSKGKPLDYVFLDVNSAFEEMTGLKKEEVVGKKLTEIHPGKNDGFDWINAFGQVALKGESVNFQQYFEPTDCWYDVIAYSDSPGYFAVLFRDITERKQAEEALRENEQRYRLLVDHAGEAIVVVQDGIVKYANPATFRTFGYSEEKLGSKPFVEFLHPEDRNYAIEEYTEVLNGKIIKPSFKIRVLTEKETIKWIEFNAVPIEWENRPAVLGFARDITKSKQAEDELRNSEEKHRRLFDTMVQGLIYQAADGTIISANRAAERILGFSLEQMQGKTSMDPHWQMIEENGTAVPGTEHPTMIALRTGKKVGPVTRGIFRTDINDHVWLNITAIPLFQPGETEPYQAYATFEDITTHKQAEEALQQAHLRLTTVVDSIDAFVYIADMESYEILFVNEYGRRLWGDITGQACWKTIQKGQDSPCPFCTNDELIDKDGNPTGVFAWEFQNTISGRWYECRDRVVRWHDDRLVRMEIASDITERKLAEQKLADYTLELEQLYRQLDAELDKARQVHERSLPKTLPTVEGISFAAHYQPAQKMGGDLYDVIHKDNKLIFYLSDVSGHGLDGAILSVFVKHAIKSYISITQPHNITPAEILRHLAEQFGKEDYEEELYFCIFIAVLDLDTLELSYCGAGFQEKMLLWLSPGDRLALSARGMFITSYLSAEILTLKDQSIVLNPGTTMFLTTDGLTEQRAQGVHYGERLPDVFYANAQLPAHQAAQAIVEDFRHFNNGSLQGNDDITFLVMQIDK